ncbi:MAG: hypothetical protein SFX18_16540 [Pirellulales bacterium]|nr:hypothetical protein [Pirellulales bacterium]
MEPRLNSEQAFRAPPGSAEESGGLPLPSTNGINPDALAQAWEKQPSARNNNASTQPPHLVPVDHPVNPSATNGDVLPQPGKRAWQFSMGTIHVLLFVAAMTFAAWAGLMQNPAANEGFPFWILLPVILPLGLFMLLGVAQKGAALYRHWRTEQTWYAEQQAQNPWSQGKISSTENQPTSPE